MNESWRDSYDAWKTAAPDPGTGHQVDMRRVFWQAYRRAAYWNEVPQFLERHRQYAFCADLVREAETRWRQSQNG